MDSLIAHWTQSPNWAKVATFLALPTAGFFTARFIDDYQGWLNMGPGGPPYNIKGYLLNLLGTAIFSSSSTETKSLGIYERPEKFAPDWSKATSGEKANAQKSFLKDSLPKRDSPSSKSIHHCAPQREKYGDEYISPQLKEAYLGAFKRLAEKHNDAIDMGRSVIEGHGDALFLKETYALPTLIAKAKREISHIHDSDMSAHLLLSFMDAREIISKGWGERHRMTGSSILPLGYTMLYVPRNIEEVETFMKIFEAGIEYAKSNGRNA